MRISSEYSVEFMPFHEYLPHPYNCEHYGFEVTKAKEDMRLCCRVRSGILHVILEVMPMKMTHITVIPLNKFVMIITDNEKRIVTVKSTSLES